MATYSFDGTTDFTPGESNARAVPNPDLVKAEGNNSEHAPASPPHVVATPKSHPHR